MGTIVTILVMAALIFNSYLDLRRREISLLAAGVIAAAGIVDMIAGREVGALELMLGLLPGGLCFLLARLTNEGIGYGDAWMLLALGVVSGGEKMLLLSITAIMAAGICAAVLLIFFHKGAKYELPFVPFLLLGFIWVRWIV